MSAQVSVCEHLVSESECKIILLPEAAEDVHRVRKHSGEDQYNTRDSESMQSPPNILFQLPPIMKTVASTMATLSKRVLWPLPATLTDNRCLVHDRY